ncbi:unnamed protein product [Alternaria sp. RS040]
MSSITQQQLAPLPAAHGTAPPPSMSHSDMFLNMIQGKSVTVIVGQHSLYCKYTLPVALLCVHSFYLGKEIAGLTTASKKRKLSPSREGEEVEAKVVVEAKDKNKDENPTEEKSVKDDKVDEERVLRLTDVDPAIFGLFLKFIYKDSYPPNVDARTPTTHYHNRSLTAVPKPTNPGPGTATALRQPSSNISPVNSNGHIQATPPLSHIPTFMPPPPSPQDMKLIEFIPPSVHAWLLGQRLGALPFMNHAISRIYAGIGVYFALTPSLMDYLRQRMSSPPPPLRKLLLDVLVTHWSRHHPSNPNAVVVRSLSVSPNFSAPLKVAWDRLFEEHTDLRNEFIYGLQGGVQLMPANAYFATPLPTGQSGMVKGGVADSDFRKEHGRVGGQAEKEVVVKQEKKGEMEVLTDKKEGGG